MSKRIFHRLTSSALLITSCLLPSFSYATIVEFQTSQGDFQVNLYDETTPVTVENFLSYTNASNYNNSVIHRSIPGFIVQGGGFEVDTVDNISSLSAVPTQSSIINEPIYSNVRATIAMAKTANNINSATNQWFFNLADNSANLDLQNGGFTVFGEVIGDGMTVIDQIAGLTTCTYSSFSEIPMHEAAEKGCSNLEQPFSDNFVTIYQVVVVDASIDSASSLTPTPTIDTDNDGVANANDAFPTDSTEWLDTDGDGTGNNADTDDDGDGHLDTDDYYPLDASRWEQPSSGSGGSFGFLGLFALALVRLKTILR